MCISGKASQQKIYIYLRRQIVNIAKTEFYHELISKEN